MHVDGTDVGGGRGWLRARATGTLRRAPPPTHPPTPLFSLSLSPAHGVDREVAVVEREGRVAIGQGEVGLVKRVDRPNVGPVPAIRVRLHPHAQVLGAGDDLRPKVVGLQCRVVGWGLVGGREGGWRRPAPRTPPRAPRLPGLPARPSSARLGEVLHQQVPNGFRAGDIDAHGRNKRVGLGAAGVEGVGGGV